ncbi:small conductance calcium-activated potassium channel protein 2 [Cricetulus griseus]|nr:small conductance calcium-activated potassium channel protein 2 [Cricetulus griseus]
MLSLHSLYIQCRKIPTSLTLGYIHPRKQNISLLGQCRRAGLLTNPGTTQAQIQGFVLAHPNNHPNTYPIYELLKCAKGLVVQNQSFRISMTQGNSRISKRTLDIVVPEKHSAHCGEAMGASEPNQSHGLQQVI